VWVWGLHVVQLVQHNGGIKFTVVFCPESLYCLVDGFFIAIPDRSVSSPAQSVVFIQILMVSDLSAKIT